ncbi:MAG TPA: hypothetical protein PLQ95_04395 [Thiobacillus sp.]|mgnify:CR=1 FL=1|nr:hypothetical protein [Thiobacillus sp.]
MNEDHLYLLDAARFNKRAAQKAKESKQQADKKKQPQPPEKHKDKDL